MGTYHNDAQSNKRHKNSTISVTPVFHVGESWKSQPVLYRVFIYITKMYETVEYFPSKLLCMLPDPMAFLRNEY